MWKELFPQGNFPRVGEHLWVVRDTYKHKVTGDTFQQVGGVIPFITFSPDSDRITLWGTLSGGDVKIEVENPNGETISEITSELSNDVGLSIPLLYKRTRYFSAQDRGFIKLYVKPTTSQATFENYRVLFTSGNRWLELFPANSTWTEKFPIASNWTEISAIES